KACVWREKSSLTLGSRLRLFSILQAQSFNRLAANYVRLDDFFDVGFIKAAIPDFVGIHDQDRTELATIKAPCFIDAHRAFAIEVELTHALFGVVEQGLSAIAPAGGARRIG